MSINNVVISGNLGADCEVSSTAKKNGTPIVKFRLAVNDRIKKDGEWEDYANWVSVTMFGNYADAISDSLIKGTKVCVSGKLRYSEWENDEGEKRNKIEVIGDSIEIMNAADDKKGKKTKK